MHFKCHDFKPAAIEYRIRSTIPLFYSYIFWPYTFLYLRKVSLYLGKTIRRFSVETEALVKNSAMNYGLSQRKIVFNYERKVRCVFYEKLCMN